MVEVLLIPVESVDDNRNIPSAFVIYLSIGVQYPLVARHRDIHCTCLAQEVYVE